MIESLEARVALAASVAEVALVGRTLTVEGTDRPDRIEIRPARPAGAVRVVVNGLAREFEGVGARSSCCAGDDVVRVGGRVTLPARIEGGAGNDRILAGPGRRTCSGAGDDVLLGGGGRSALDGGSGRDRIVIARCLGTIFVGPSAAGEASRVLGRGYRLARLGMATRRAPGRLWSGRPTSIARPWSGA